MADDNILVVDEPKVEEKAEELKAEETKIEEKEPEISLEDPVIEQPSIEEIKTKYPNILKDFPQLRKVIFRDLEYAKLFPTVAEAKEAVENNESFETVRTQVLSGDMESFLDSVKDAKALDKVAENFLPALKKTSSDAYDRIVSPLIQDILTAAYNNARASGNKNLENSSLHLANFLFGESGSLKTAEPKKEDNQEPERNYQAQKAVDFSEDVLTSASEQLRAAVAEGLTGVSEEQKEYIIEKTIKELGKKLDNADHVAYMNSFWKSAGNAGYPSSHKPRIVSAYLARAKPLIPALRNKFRSTFNGKTSSGEETHPDLGSGRIVDGSKGPKDPKSIDWRQTSDADFIEGRIKYKK